MLLSDEGLGWIARWEGFRGEVYEDPAGHTTIGYGHLVHLGPIDGSEPAAFRAGISRDRALELLREDVRRSEEAVNRLVTVPLLQGQFDVLVSFTFNVGPGALERSALLRRLNAGEPEAVPRELLRWVYAGGQRLAGLVRRREAEGQMWRAAALPVAKPLPHWEALRGMADKATWWAEESKRALEQGEPARADELLGREVLPRLAELREGLL